MAGQGVSFLDKVRQVPQLAKLHDQMYMCRCFLAVDQRHDVGMMKAFQNVNLGVKVFLQLFVELVQVDGFDSYVARLLLQTTTIISTRNLSHAARVPIHFVPDIIQEMMISADGGLQPFREGCLRSMRLYRP